MICLLCFCSSQHLYGLLHSRIMFIGISYGESLTVVETFDKAIALISCAWLLRLITTTERSKAIRSLEGMTHQTIRRALKRLVQNH